MLFDDDSVMEYTAVPGLETRQQCPVSQDGWCQQQPPVWESCLDSNILPPSLYVHQILQWEQWEAPRHQHWKSECCRTLSCECWTRTMQVQRTSQWRRTLNFNRNISQIIFKRRDRLKECIKLQVFFSPLLLSIFQLSIKSTINIKFKGTEVSVMKRKV